MEKIIILGDPSKRNNELIASLHLFFPECEIQVQSKHGVSHEQAPSPRTHPDRERGKKNV
jgi:hypothetical protein